MDLLDGDFAMTVREVAEYKRALRRDPCAYCGKRFWPVPDGIMPPVLDGIVARSRGGSHAWDNLTLACCCCNQSKNAASLLGYLLYSALWSTLESIKMGAIARGDERRQMAVSRYRGILRKL